MTGEQAAAMIAAGEAANANFTIDPVPGDGINKRKFKVTAKAGFEQPDLEMRTIKPKAVKGAAIIPPGLPEIGVATLRYTDGIALGGGVVSFGVESTFVATFLTNLGDTSFDILTALQDDLINHGFITALSGPDLTIASGEEFFVSSTDTGLSWNYLFGTMQVPEPSGFILMLVGIVILGLRSMLHRS